MVRKYQLYVCLILILKLFSIRSKVGQKMGSGFNKTISSYGIIGFVRFLEGYYMILITSRLKAAMLGMAIWVVEFSSGGYKVSKIFA